MCEGLASDYHCHNRSNRRNHASEATSRANTTVSEYRMSEAAKPHSPSNDNT